MTIRLLENAPGTPALIWPGNDIVITKVGQVIYEHEDEKVTLQAKSEKGDILDMVFNNTTGEAKVYLNGGDQIDLKAKTAASGIWYANDNYELSGKKTVKSFLKTDFRRG